MGTKSIIVKHETNFIARAIDQILLDQIQFWRMEFDCGKGSHDAEKFKKCGFGKAEDGEPESENFPVCKTKGGKTESKNFPIAGKFELRVFTVRKSRAGDVNWKRGMPTAYEEVDLGEDCTRPTGS